MFVLFSSGEPVEAEEVGNRDPVEVGEVGSLLEWGEVYIKSHICF